MNKLEELREEIKKVDTTSELSSTAMIAMSTVVVVQLVTLPDDDLDTPLVVALYAFAVAIPMLSLTLWMMRQKAIYDAFGMTIQPERRWQEPVAEVLGGFSAVIGVGAIFWHFSSAIGLVFTLASVFAAGVLHAWYTMIETRSAPALSHAKRLFQEAHSPSETGLPATGNTPAAPSARPHQD